MAKIKKIKVGTTIYDVEDAEAIHSVDSSLSTTSENPVQNKIITVTLNNKQNKLEAGSNITISSLPSGYTQLEYIESSGAQYIDTIWTYNSSKLPVTIDCVFATTQNKAESVIYGLQDSGYTNWIYPIYAPSSDGEIVSYIGNATYRSWFTALVGTKYSTKIELSNDMMTRTVNGSTDSSYYTPTISTTAHMLLFAGSLGENTPTNYCKAKIYSFFIIENEKTTINLIPVKNSSDVIGMYDTVTNTFFTNSGTGSFIGGPEVSSSNIISATVPTKTSQLTNDSEFTNASYDAENERLVITIG